MTLARGAAVSALMLAATVWLVGFCGVVGLLVWLAVVCVIGCAPDAALGLATSVRVQHVRDAWRWLDQRW